MTLLSVLLFGFLLGMKHATEADHLAAVATLATRRQSAWDALRQGAAWGLGHSVTLMVFGGGVLLLGRAVPPQLEAALELLVGVMLVLLGTDVLWRLRRNHVHFHAHTHGGGAPHFHAHSHRQLAAPAAAPRYAGLRFLPAIAEPHGSHDHEHPAGLPRRAMLVGMMHGLAGTAALVVLSLQAVPSIGLGLLYILLFGLGSVLGMALLSVAIAVPLRRSGELLTGLHRGMTAALGLFSALLGLWVIAQSAAAITLLSG